MIKQRTLIIVKPDGVQRRLVGEIIKRFEKRNLKIVALKMIKISEDLAKKHYAEHLEKPFFHSLKDFITSDVSIALVVEGENAITLARKMIGATNYINADPGTIRGDFAFSTTENIVHGSDSIESAKREIELFFNKDELFV